MGPRLLPEPVAGCRPKSTALLDRFPEVDRDLEIAQSLHLTAEAFASLPDDEQELWIARHERDRARCPKCRGDRDRCSDPEQLWYPERTVCYADMETAAANRRYELLHTDEPYHDGTFTSWAKEPIDSNGDLTHPYHFRDGVTIWVSPVDLSPGDRFLTDPNWPVSPPEPEGGDE